MRLRSVLIFVLVLAFASAVDGHPVPFSYLDVQLHNASIDLTLTVHIYDLAHDLQVAPMERLLGAAFLEEHASAIQQVLGPRLALQADGQQLSPVWRQPEIIADRQSVRFHLEYALKMPPGTISVSTVMFPYDEN